MKKLQEQAPKTMESSALNRNKVSYREDIEIYE